MFFVRADQMQPYVAKFQLEKHNVVINTTLLYLKYLLNITVMDFENKSKFGYSSQCNDKYGLSVSSVVLLDKLQL